ncbi:MAG: TonB family protein [Nitrospinales bacterium]
MTTYYFPKRLHPHLEKAILLSLLLHILAFILHGLTPRTMPVTPRLEPIKVKFIETPKEKVPDRGTLIDAPKPRRIEKPRTAKLLAKFDSRAHSNVKKNKASDYRHRKLVAPKLRGRHPAIKKRKVVPPRKKRVVKPRPGTIQKTPLRPPSNKGLQLGINPRVKKPAPAEEQQTPRSLFALLDGFDASPYAETDTGAQEDFDDGETISLDTKETLYADYFARIKHQIERVWGYPESAARRGISGQLTLRFQISKEGNLLRVHVTQASGAEILDRAAVKAVKMAAPYYPFPATIKKEKLAILATFIYSPSYGRSYQYQTYR